jgi:hypothetical protein
MATPMRNSDRKPKQIYFPTINQRAKFVSLNAAKQQMKLRF